MECCEMREKLSCYIDGDLDKATTEQVDAHLAECSDCREELAELRLLVTVARNTCEQEPPSALRQAIMAAVRDAEAETRHDAEMKVLVSAFIDGELSAADLERVTHHLAACNGCREQLSDIRTLTLAAHQIDPIEPPATLRSSIAAATSTRRVQHNLISLREWLKRITSPGTARWAAGAATAGVIVLGIMVETPNGSRQAERASLEHQKPVSVASRLDSAQPKGHAAGITLENKAPEKSAAASITEASRRRVVLKHSREVVVAANTGQTVHVSLLRAKPNTATAKTKSSNAKPAVPEASQHTPEPVDVASVEGPDTTTTENGTSAEVKKSGSVDVANVTAEEQESIRQWLQEAKARAATKKSSQNSGITLLSKEF